MEFKVFTFLKKRDHITIIEKDQIVYTIIESEDPILEYKFITDTDEEKMSIKFDTGLLRDRYHLSILENEVSTIEESVLSGNTFVAKSPMTQYFVDGSFLSSNCIISNEEKEVAKISRQKNSKIDHWGVAIMAKEESEFLLLLAAVVIIKTYRNEELI